MLVAAIAATALAVQAPAAPPSCAAALAALMRAHEENYAGYTLEVLPAPARLAAYRQRVGQLTAHSATGDRMACLALLQAYVAFFDDPHLFVADTPDYSPAQAEARRLPAESRTPAEVDASLAAARGGDPIVGRWFEAGRDYAIIPGPGRGRFLAVETTEGDAAHPRGRIVAHFARLGRAYQATLIQADGTPRRHEARLHRGLILHMPPLLWGRRGAAPDRLDAANPGAPAFALLGERAALLSLPSFDPGHRAALDRLLETHAAAIQARDLLIVDLRGNVGGASTMIGALAPYYYAPSEEAPSLSWADAYILSGPLNISVVEGMAAQQAGAEDRAFFADLLARLRAAPGRLVRIAPQPEVQAALARNQQRLFAETIAPPRLFARPGRIAFLVDDQTVSAPEAALLSVRRSPKVTIFGRNTAGATDYQNVVMFTVGAGEWRFSYGLPTITATDRLPRGGYRATGVPVDVPLDLDRADPIAAILRHYRMD
ncbi:MAG TPA: hypothetical protein VMG08_10125 [Allosphingosinicella sp.]|nr:hypothetical protein [Allosphingosinicella sp.]